MHKKITVPNDAHLNVIKRLNESAFFILLALGILLLIALFTFNVEDPGWTHNGAGQPVTNAIGVVGAWLTDFMLSIVGLMAFTFPFMLFNSAWTFLHDTREKEKI